MLEEKRDASRARILAARACRPSKFFTVTGVIIMDASFFSCLMVGRDALPADRDQDH